MQMRRKRDSFPKIRRFQKGVEKTVAEVTVVIPNYNGIKFMKGCLEALYAQTDAPSFRVLVIDNGSTDGSREEVRDCFPQAELICLEENTGFCHAVNVGIEHADSPYVILLNNDTKVYPEFVKCLYESIRKRDNAFSVSARMLMWDDPTLLDGAGDNYMVFGYSRARGKGKKASLYEKPAEVFSACGGAAIYRKTVFEEIGLFDELHFAYLEDLDVGYRAQIFGYRNYYEPGAMVVHYGSASSGPQYNAWKTEISAANNVYVVFKNMPFLQRLFNFPFLFVGYLVKFLFFSRKKLGKIYVKGLWKGLKKSFSAQGRANRVPYRMKHSKSLLRIQLKLFRNIF